MESVKQNPTLKMRLVLANFAAMRFMMVIKEELKLLVISNVNNVIFLVVGTALFKHEDLKRLKNKINLKICRKLLSVNILLLVSNKMKNGVVIVFFRKKIKTSLMNGQYVNQV